MIETDHDRSAAPAGAKAGAGVLLRDAREAGGMPVEELAAVLKVVPRKIELMEAEQFDQFPDLVFVRALAQSMCRTLKIAAAPVLALLPQTPAQRLDKIHVGLNAQFRDRPTQILPDDWNGIGAPLIWGPALLVVAAAVVYFFPTSWLNPPKVSPRATSAAPAASGFESTTAAAPNAAAQPGELVIQEAAPKVAPVVAPATVPATVPAPTAPLPTPPAAAPAPTSVAVAPAPAVAPPAASAVPAEKVAASVGGVLQFRTSGDSWIEVQDARGLMLLSRNLESGEAVGLNGATPLKVTIGNVRATQVMFRGKAMDLALFTRDNIARFELK